MVHPDRLDGPQALLGGHYSVGRTTAEPGRTGVDLVELDEKFNEVGVHRTVGLVDTDGHDVAAAPRR